EKHAAALRFFGDDVLRLGLGPDKENGSPFGGEGGDELFGFTKELDRLAQVDDVDAVAFAEDVLLHLRIPALRLVTEVHSGLQQILQRDSGQITSSGARRRPVSATRSVAERRPRVSLPFTELEALARSRHAVLLPLLGAGIAREEPFGLERFTQFGAVLDERACDAESHRARLSRHAAAID